jgi:glycosyltransferase involved in cell wall biosynthesis
MTHKTVLQIDTVNNYGGVRRVASMIADCLDQKVCTAILISVDDMLPKGKEPRLWRWMVAAIRLKKFLTDHKVDIVVAHHPIILILIPLLSKITMVYTVHGPISPISFKKRVIRWKMRLLHEISCLRADVVVCVSKGLESELSNWSRSKSRIIKNAPSTSFYKDNEIKSYFNSLSEYKGTKIVNFSRQTAQKNQEFCIKILHEIRKKSQDAKLFLIGDGEDSKKLRNYCQRNGVAYDDCKHDYNDDAEVYFLPPIEGLAWLRDCFDVAIFPSRYEGYPLSLLECLSIGLPVIHSDCKYGPYEVYEELLENKIHKELLDSMLVLLPVDSKGESSLEEWVDALASISKQRFPIPGCCEMSFHQIRMKSEWENLIVSLSI